MKTAFLAIASALALAACNEPSQPQAATGTEGMSPETQAESVLSAEGQEVATPVNAPAPEATPTDAPTYVAMAGASDLFEIQSSNAILEKKPRDEVRRFAEMMIKHHTESTNKVTAAAKAAGMTVPPPVLTSEQQRMIADIRNATDNAEAVYFDHQRTAHQKALMLHESFAKSGDTDGLKTVAAEIVPVVQSHIDQLQKIGPTPA